jgi:nitroimidazol reductase NimA-like FMN-containing flavoprotein (pyridoxamine 5'-phosphate oxidase superfamily)
MEIQDQVLVSQIIEKCQVCRLALAKDGVPYMIPVCFGYDGQAIYVHTAREGQKIDYIVENNRVCFEFEDGVRLLSDGEDPCSWTFSYQSVIGQGTIQELVNENEKIEGLNHIVAHYAGPGGVFSPAVLDRLRVWKIEVETMTGKQSSDWADSSPQGTDTRQSTAGPEGAVVP